MHIDEGAAEGRGRVAALTGITGFIGGHVARRLAEHGWRIRALARSMPRLPALPGGAVEVVPGTLSDPGALCELVRGADAVVHLAGAVKGRTAEDFERANTVATAALATAWREAAPGALFLHMSSMAAREPGLSYYAASKRAAEDRLIERAGDGRWCILRPAAVYGPGDRETLAIFRAAAGPVQPMLNGPAARVTSVHAADLANAVRVMLEAPQPGAILEVTDAEVAGYSWDVLSRAAAAALGRPARPLRVPAPVLRTLGLCGDLAALAGGSRMITSPKVREMLHADWSSHPSRQIDAVLWRPRIGLAEGFAGAVAWYRKAGWLG